MMLPASRPEPSPVASRAGDAAARQLESPDDLVGCARVLDVHPPGATLGRMTPTRRCRRPDRAALPEAPAMFAASPPTRASRRTPCRCRRGRLRRPPRREPHARRGRYRPVRRHSMHRAQSADARRAARRSCRIRPRRAPEGWSGRSGRPCRTRARSAAASASTRRMSISTQEPLAPFSSDRSLRASKRESARSHAATSRRATSSARRARAASHRLGRHGDHAGRAHGPEQVALQAAVHVDATRRAALR